MELLIGQQGCKRKYARAGCDGKHDMEKMFLMGEVVDFWRDADDCDQASLSLDDHMKEFK